MFLTMTFILLYFDMKNKVSLKSSNLNSKITLLFLFLCNKQTNKYCWHPFPSSNLWVLQPAVFYQIQMPFFSILQCSIFLFCFWSWIECGLQGVAPRCALRAVPSRNTGWATQLLMPLNTSLDCRLRVAQPFLQVFSWGMDEAAFSFLLPNWSQYKQGI